MMPCAGGPGWQKTIANFRQGRSGQLRNFQGNPVISMPGMAAAITIDPIPHVNQFLRHNDLNCSRLGAVDPLQVDQNGVNLMPLQINVCAADGTAGAPAKPFFKPRFRCCDPQ